MNVIVANKYASMLQSLNIEVIKSVTGQFDVDELIANFKSFYYNRMILDITALKNYSDIRTLQKLSVAFDMDKVILVLEDSSESSSSTFLSNIISIGIYNFAKNADGILYLLNNPNTYRDVAQYHNVGLTANPTNTSNQSFFRNDGIDPNIVGTSPTRIIGFKNVTKEAGATTLIYLCKKELSKYYSVVALEVGRGDFRYFNDKDLISTTDADIASIIARNSDKEVILVDINDKQQVESMCHEVIYLVEPSIIKLNRVMLVNNNALQKLKNKKVILNQSLLDSKDVNDFEYESRINIFYNMPNIDDRDVDLKEIDEFLLKLGFSRIEK